MLKAADLDMARFTPGAPSWLPPTPFDARAAWIGSFTHTPDVPIRVEAAAWRAWRHVRQGGADLRAASRAGAVLFGCSLVDWACRGNHLPTIAELSRFGWALSEATFYGATFWALYVALEPYVRRRWPESLISWSRLIAGGIRHPLVGGHLLVGLAFGVAYIVIFSVGALLQGVGYSLVLLPSVVDTPRMVSTFIVPAIRSSQLAMGMFFVFFLPRVLLRRPWLAAIVFVVLGALPSVLATPEPLIGGAEAVVQFGLAIFILSRFAVLPMVVGLFVSTALPPFPLTTNFATWYAGSTLFAFGSVVALTAYALYAAIDRRPIFAPGLLEQT